MGKNLSQSRQPRLQKNDKIYPHVRYNRTTEEWDVCTTKESQNKMDSIITIQMTREELDIIARLIAYMYHDKRDEYEEIASDLRKEHIYRDLRSIDAWLNSQYKQLEDEDEQPKQEERQRL